MEHQKNNDELLDVVDENDVVVGQEWRSVIYKTDTKYKVRAIWLFLKNKEGKLWIPRRAATKNQPLALDGSVVGCVSAGETYEQALEREAVEEINMAVAGKYRCIGYVSPSEKITVSHIKVYIMDCDETPHYRDTEFCEDFWLTPQEVIKKCEDEKTKRATLPNVIKKFFL